MWLAGDQQKVDPFVRSGALGSLLMSHNPEPVFGGHQIRSSSGHIHFAF
jgi:hypothetical protein